MGLRKSPVSPEMALSRLEALCARSEQCTFDLRRKLSTWGVAADSADKIVMRLERDGFVDDARYAVAYVRDKYRFARWGRNKIRMGLAAKRISSTDVRQALAAIDDDEYREIMAALLRAKARVLGIAAGCEYADKVRLMRFGVSRGFEYDLVTNAVREICG